MLSGRLKIEAVLNRPTKDTDGHSNLFIVKIRHHGLETGKGSFANSQGVINGEHVLPRSC